MHNEYFSIVINYILERIFFSMTNNNVLKAKIYVVGTLCGHMDLEMCFQYFCGLRNWVRSTLSWGEFWFCLTRNTVWIQIQFHMNALITTKSEFKYSLYFLYTWNHLFVTSFLLLWDFVCVSSQVYKNFYKLCYIYLNQQYYYRRHKSELFLIINFFWF